MTFILIPTYPFKGIWRKKKDNKKASILKGTVKQENMGKKKSDTVSRQCKISIRTNTEINQTSERIQKHLQTYGQLLFNIKVPR